MPECNGLVLSVVSHEQRALLLRLLEDLERHVRIPFRLIVTENVPEAPDLPVSNYSYPIEVVRNSCRKGFGANHNRALARSNGELFCVLNPDIRLHSDPFPALCESLADPRIGVVGPVVTDSGLTPEDHARRFPSIFTLMAKFFLRGTKGPRTGHDTVYYPDWVAGMFMLFRTQTLRSVGGFDERYFLYYEDVDLCARLRESGYEVAVRPEAKVVHEARRESRRNLRFAMWHIRSALRFFASRPSIALGIGRHRQIGSGE